eukprot:451473-Heterocapsa_arctica.AAC.1
MLVRHRLVQSLDHIQACLDVTKVPAPVLRGQLAAGATVIHAAKREEKYYESRIDLCKRLSVC